MNIKITCECMDSECQLEIDISTQVAIEKFAKQYVFIAEKCLNGPSEGDMLVEERDGYSVYTETQ